MFDNTTDFTRSAQWIVCESSGRWLNAIRRFSPDWHGPVGIPCSAAVSPTEVYRQLPSGAPRIVLWEVSRNSLVQACENLAQAARLAPRSLQLVAGPAITTRQWLVLAEFPVATFVRHPEDLPRLRPMIQGYFARWPHSLD